MVTQITRSHFLKLIRSLSANNLLRHASASPLWRMKPAKAMMSFFPVILPDSSTYIDTLKNVKNIVAFVANQSCLRLKPKLAGLAMTEW